MGGTTGTAEPLTETAIRFVATVDVYGYDHDRSKRQFTKLADATRAVEVLSVEDAAEDAKIRTVWMPSVVRGGLSTDHRTVVGDGS
jgi:hypothetical protein